MFETEERSRVKRVKIEQAVNLAMQSRWAEAAELNRQLIDSFPKEVEAYNRLGKALMELTKYDDAREAYNHALHIEPANSIAQKNLQRLESLREAPAAVVSTGVVDPSLFIAETGKATVTALVELAPPEVLATVDAGDPLSLEVQDSSVLVRSALGEALGKLEPKLRQRLIRLTQMGNQYSAVVTGADDQSLRIIIRETYRDPSMGDRPSFATTGDTFRGYTRDSLLRYDLEDEEEDTEELEHEPDAEAEPEIVRDVLVEDEPHAAGVVVVHDDDDDDEP